ncbi:alpha/beta hydrolase [Natrialbaceae archaeon AArc-T1-2]|uniref:alpha/beta hydrolase n=1 Tax=Natrialbaceae archaeon AArc-T1-2 TaxID=3053904 RepID=UPI00255AB0A9|nr:alpha/beta hydrolase [Natrialbaceae archaeon AArc-T1-2]WIV68404.1 alpha/beta hydrolase [Natrialbaceae archaeon AArc-T1-2]
MTDVPIPGGRDVRGTLETPETPEETDAIVVACPPHPRHGGHRGDRRLLAVAEALLERDVASLRFDYGPWDEGYGEREDVRNAIRWASDRHDHVGVFGYSFGASQAILASATVDRPVEGVTALAPTASLGESLAVVPALGELDCPVQVLYGERDTTADWEPITERARELGYETVALSGDHFFVGQQETIADEVASFLADALE